MNLKEALKRIKELEKRVMSLEAGRPVEQHNHYHYDVLPQPFVYPQQPWISPYFVSYSAGDQAPTLTVTS